MPFLSRKSEDSISKEINKQRGFKNRSPVILKSKIEEVIPEKSKSPVRETLR
jgi:hypothetical protein